MICPHSFIKALKQRNIAKFAGVPDSLLKEFCKALAQECPAEDHLITANEGNAVGFAIGHHLATGKYAAVYMQNSGLGNAVNPLVSLAAPEIYAVGMLLIIGWRGEPGIKDEPQHLLQGKITEGLLKTIGIPYSILDSECSVDEQLDRLLSGGRLNVGPVALLIRKDTFAKAKPLPSQEFDNSKMLREEFIRLFLQHAKPEDLVVATTGKTSRELFELREAHSEPHRDFLVVGGMGHASSIALGLAMARPARKVYCLDGDGAMLMHMGALPVLGGQCRPTNLVYVVLNNGVHESVGGQPTSVEFIDLQQLAFSCRFKHFFRVTDCENGHKVFVEIAKLAGPIFIEAVIRPGSRKELGRPTRTPVQNKSDLMEYLNAADVV